MLRVAGVITGALVISSVASVEETCNADLGECGDADVSLAQLRIRKTSKTNATTDVTANATRPIWDRTPYSVEGGCIAMQIQKCNGVGRCGSAATCGNDDRCICNSGCAGADGRCHQMGNERVMHNFVIQNVGKERKMYIQAWNGNNQIRTASDWSSWSKLGRTNFNLYALPGSSGNQKRYVMTSEMFPQWAFTTWPTENGAYQGHRFVARKMKDAKSLAEIAVMVCDMSSMGFPGELAIGGTINGERLAGNKPTVAWANLNSPSEYVYGNDVNTLSDLGAGARWKVTAWSGTKPQPGEFPECQGNKRR
jgi:hypothetical protein